MKKQARGERSNQEVQIKEVAMRCLHRESGVVGSMVWNAQRHGPGGGAGGG